MSNFITQGFSKSDSYNIGGLRKIYIANTSQVASITASTSGGAYDTIAMDGTTGQYKFYVLEPTKNSASFTQELQVGANKYWAMTLTCSSANNSQAMIDTMMALGIGNFVAIGEDRNGNRRLLFKGNGGEATVLTNNSGAAEGDASNYTFTLSGAELEIAPLFHASATIPQ